MSRLLAIMFDDQHSVAMRTHAGQARPEVHKSHGHIPRFKTRACIRTKAILRRGLRPRPLNVTNTCLARPRTARSWSRSPGWPPGRAAAPLATRAGTVPRPWPVKGCPGSRYRSPRPLGEGEGQRAGRRRRLRDRQSFRG